MLKSNFWLLTFGCPPDNQIIVLGCPAHVLVVSGKHTTVILNAAHNPQPAQPYCKILGKNVNCWFRQPYK